MIFRRFAFGALFLVALVALAVGAFALYLAVSFHTAVARIDGSVRIPGLRAPVQIVRDERDIPHIWAANEHDLFLAQGYAEGSDRLFQMDLTRHAVYGRLAEWFGAQALLADERSRIVDVRGIAARQFVKLSARHRAQLQAFSNGVNAAVRMQPLPFEYRLLVIRPKPWQPQDSLAVGFATVLVLADSYRDVLERDLTHVRLGKEDGPARSGRSGYDATYPLSDPKYDAPTVGALKPPFGSIAAQMPPMAIQHAGSNAWAAGSIHTRDGRALLASDPHLAPSIPGIWYLVDLQAPGYHAAGASLAGTPGVILGHNDAIAWGATNGSVAALSVFCGLQPHKGDAVQEQFHVRFGRAQSRTYFREKRGFFINNEVPGHESCLVAWAAYGDPSSPLQSFDGLDRATSIESALRALSSYPGPTQNFVLAQRDGRVAYQLAGWIPSDPAWARYAHRDGYRAYPVLPFKVLPHVSPSRLAIVWTANNRMYGNGYPYRLSAAFEPPYRAFRIRTLLEARHKYDVAYFSRMQGDTYSVAELELSKTLVALAHNSSAFLGPAERPIIATLAGWDGRYDPDSIGATIAHDMRANATGWNGHDTTTALLQELRLRKPGVDGDRRILGSALSCRDAPLAACVRKTPWRDAGAVPILHPLHSLGVTWLDGPTLPGDGDKFTLHVQRKRFTQSFRAVWDVGDWDRGGIVIPCGESGEPGSSHYQDLTPVWKAQRLVALPYSRAAVRRHTVATQVLTP